MSTYLPTAKPRSLLYFNAVFWTSVASGILTIVDIAIPWMTRQAMRYCRKYGHTFVTYLDGEDACAICHLDEIIAVSIDCLEEQ